MCIFQHPVLGYMTYVIFKHPVGYITYVILNFVITKNFPGFSQFSPQKRDITIDKQSPKKGFHY